MLLMLESQRFRLLLFALAARMGSQALGLDRLADGTLVAAIGVSLVAAALWVLHPRRPLFWTALVLALPTLRELVVPGSSPTDLAQLAGSSVHAPFFSFTAAALATRVVRSERADEDTVIGSICAYLFIAYAFTSVYAALDFWTVEPFGFAHAGTETRIFDRLHYFSLVTITTLGYGDIVPVSALARSVVSLEAVVGILYPSIVIARIIGLYASGGGRPFSLPVGRRRPGRFQLLLAAELVLLFALPSIREGSGAQLAIRLLVPLLLLTALYAGSDRPGTRAFGIGLTALALAARWWTGPDGALPSEAAALGLEAALLAFVAGSLFVWLIAEKHVTRDLLLAAIALYLLLGYAFAAAFGVLELYAPGSLAGSLEPPMSRSDLVYYSFMTLTTTGFGDLAPLSPAAQRLANLESLLGILYPSVLVARLVSLYDTD
jgi:voltage-gated potassium channel Kch